VTRTVIIRPYVVLPTEGGSNDRYVSLCRKLIEAGAAPELLCSDFIHNAKRRRSAAEIAKTANSLPFVTCLPAPAYKGNISLGRIFYEIVFGGRALWNMMRKPRPDVLLVGEPLFGVGWMMLLYGFLFRVPVVADLIDLWPEADTEKRGGFLRHAVYAILKTSRNLRLHAYRAVSFVSRSYRDALGFGDGDVFYWGSELRPQAEHAPPGQPLTVIYAGSFGVGYDIVTVLQAAAMLKDRAPGRFRFRLAGLGPQLPEVERAKARGDIDYLGMLDAAQLGEAYRTADIGLLPYRAGSAVAMPIKFYDYLNFGLYVVGSGTMESRDIMLRERIGNAYRAGDAEDLVRCLLQIDEAAILRAREACAKLAGEYSIDRQYGRFARFVLNHARRADPS